MSYITGNSNISASCSNVPVLSLSSYKSRIALIESPPQRKKLSARVRSSLPRISQYTARISGHVTSCDRSSSFKLILCIIVHNTTIIYRVLFVVSTGKRCCLHTTSDTAKIIYNVNSAPSSINNPSKAKTA